MLRGTGSGFFITADGFLLSNCHVVNGASAIRIKTPDGVYDAHLVDADPRHDLALLKVEGSFTPVEFSPTASAVLGQTVFTVGFPLPDVQGLSPKVTKGIISSLRGIQDDNLKYQIDATIQPGNSGGPLAESSGALVGVIVSSLNERAVAEAYGALPQNVNYAIKNVYVKAFLQDHPEVRIKTSIPDPSISFERAVANVQAATVMVLIYQENPASFENLSQPAPNDTSATMAIIRYNNGITFQRRQEWDKAVVEYQAALQLNPRMAKAWFNLGLIYSIKNTPTRARDAYEHAVEIQPDMVAARYNLALLLREARNLQAAIAQLLEVLRLKPDYAGAYYTLGYIYADDPKATEQARSAYTKFLELAPDAPNAEYVRAWLSQH